MTYSTTQCVKQLCFYKQFTFSFRVACFSILSDCFGLCGGLSLSSHHTPCWLLFRLFRHRDVFKMQPRSPPDSAGVDQLQRKSTKTELCGVLEKLFSGKVRHVVKSFPFFWSCLFSLVAIADFWALCGGRHDGLCSGSLSQEQGEQSVNATLAYELFLLNKDLQTLGEVMVKENGS